MAQPTNITQGRSNRGFIPSTEDAALAAPPINGGKIQGPGTGTSDSIPDQMAEGTFIMPADSTKAMGIKTLNQLANMPAVQGNFTPEQAHAAGVAFLTSLRDATHTPVQQEEMGEQEATEMPVEDDPAQRNFADGGVVEDEPIDQNSSGDAAAAANDPGVTQVEQPAPQVQQQAPQVQQQAPTSAPKQDAQKQDAPQADQKQARAAPNFFPYNSPDAGANIYAGFGFGGAAPKQDAPPKQDAQPQKAPQKSPPKQQTAPDPMAAHNQKLEAAQGLQSWRQSQGTSSSPAARQNYLDLQQKAVDMRPSYFAQQGPMSAQAPAAAELAASRALQSMYTQKPPAAASTPAAAPDANPYANVTTEQGRAMAEINAKAQAQSQSQSGQPQPNSQPPEGRDMGGGVTRIDRPGHSPLFTDNKDPDMARPAGGPTKEVNDIMQRMSDKSRDEALRGFQREANAAQYAREVQQAQAINAAGGENARNVQNRMDQEKYLRKLDVAASSIFGTKQERLGRQQAYQAALAQDAGFRAGADAGSVARTQNEGSSARERMQQTGATERAQALEAGTNARFDQTQGMAQQKFGMEREAHGFTARAAAQSEQLRNTLLDPNATPEQRSIAQRNLAALSGKTAADRMQTVTLPDTINEMGQVVRGGQVLVRTLEDGTVEQVPIGAQQQGAAQPLPQDPSKRKAGDVYTAPNGTRVKWDGKGLVPAQ